MSALRREGPAPRATALAAALCVTLGATLAAPAAQGQTIDPAFAGAYGFHDLGTVGGIIGGYGALTFLDAGTLLVGGRTPGVIYRAPVVRDGAGRVTSIGTATPFAAAPDIDGGLAFGPGGVLFYTSFPQNVLGQIEPGSAAPDRLIDLDGLAGTDVAGRVGTLGFVPAGRPGAGNFRLLSYESGTLYAAFLTADGGGTFGVSVFPEITLPGGPRGMAWVPLDAPLFAAPSLLISEFDLRRVSAYDTNADGDPIDGTRRTLVSGLTGGNAGATVDPVSGDFLFATFGLGAGEGRILQVARLDRTVVPEPSTVALSATGLVALAALARRRRSDAPARR